MKIHHIFLVLLATALNGCSGQEEADEALQTDDNDQGANQAAMANEDAGDGTNEELNAENGEQENMGNQEAQQGADLNSDTSNDTELVNNNAAEGAQSSNPLADNAGGNPLANTDTPPPTNSPTENSTASAPAAILPATEAAPSAASTSSDTAPIPGGRVLYVPEGGVQVLNEPNGSPVVTLNQGDHPLAWEESGWLKLANGMFVPAGSLSEKGVPRPFIGAMFQK